jgi:Domain of unknown function (DUF4124)
MRNGLPAYVTRLRPALLVGLLALGGMAMAADPGSGATTLYRWVDAQGVVHYSDTPQPGAQKLQIAPAQTFQFTQSPGGRQGRAAINTPPARSPARSRSRPSTHPCRCR